MLSLILVVCIKNTTISLSNRVIIFSFIPHYPLGTSVRIADLEQCLFNNTDGITANHSDMPVFINSLGSAD